MVMSNGKVVAYDKRETFERLFIRVSGLMKNVDKITDGLETYDIKTLPYSNAEYGVYEYDGKICASASYGVSGMPLLEGEIYILTISSY